jgi:hypothetical protein
MSWETKARAVGVAPPARPERTYRPNRYAGRCWRCAGWLEAGGGIAILTSETQAEGAQAAYPWQVQHLGECSAPKPVRPEPAPEPDVPEGRYAVDLGPEGDGDEPRLRFFKVDRPTEGRWVGRTFVSVQAGPNLIPLREAGSRRAILRRIAEDPQAAMLRYGLELGHCGSCGAELTNAESRARGIGPICAAKYGW